MKTKEGLALFVAILAVALVLSGCNRKAGQSAANRRAGNDFPSGQAGGSGRPGRMPDFGQPDRQPDMRGVVKSIIGNEATILKMDAAGGQRASSSPAGLENASTSSQGIEPKAFSANMPGGGMPGARGGMPGGGMPGGGPGGPDGGETTGTREAMFEELKKMSAGEEKVTIPVGIKMLKASETDRRAMVEATLEDITADKMITLWFDQSVTDKKVVEFVLIN